MAFPSLAYLERFRNEGTRTYSRHSDYSEAEPLYQPARAASTFSLLRSRSGRGENWGCLAGDMRPLPANKAEKYLIPGFALYGRDLLVHDRSLLLWDLIGSENPVETISPRFFPITVTGCRSMSIISAKFVTSMVNRLTRTPGARRYGGHN